MENRRKFLCDFEMKNLVNHLVLLVTWGVYDTVPYFVTYVSSYHHQHPVHLSLSHVQQHSDVVKNLILNHEELPT
jgi:hypothetical protein